MKIRIKGDSIRFRLTRTEVEKLCSEGYIEEKTPFASNNFTYAVQKRNDPYLNATFIGNTIILHIPANLLEGWDRNDLVGFEHRMDLGEKGSLFLLLEKDFVCLDQRNDDQSDQYPNPKAL